MQNKTNLIVAAVTLAMVSIMVMSILHQPFSWWVVPFVTLFGTLFVGVLAICVSIFREDRVRARAKVAHPDQPWLWEAKWQTDMIPSNSKSSFRSGVGLFVVLAMFALMSLAQIIDKLPKGNLWTLLGLIPLFAAIYIGGKTVSAWKALKLDRSVSLHLLSRPVWIGAALSAELRLPDRVRREDITVHLELLKTIKEEDTEWTSFTTLVDRTLLGDIESFESANGQATARIHVDIPPNSPETGWTEEDSQRWELVVTVRDKGKQLSIRFDVPIADPDRYELTG